MRKDAGRRWALAGFATLALAAAPAFATAATTPSPGNQHAWLGVVTQTLTPELREGMSYTGPGVLVNRVIPDSPADRAGLEKGDIITSFNSRSIDSPEALAAIVGQGRVGQTASLQVVVRDGRSRNLSVKLAGRSDDDEMDMGDPDRHVIRIKDLDLKDLDLHMQGLGELGQGIPGMWRSMGRGRLGVRIESLNADLGSYFSVPGGKGVLIVEVLKDTPAEKAGLKAGDVIMRVGDQSVLDAEDLIKALGGDEGKVALGIVRKGDNRTISVELEKQEHVIRIRRGDGAMGYGDTRRTRVTPDSRREIDELRRQVDELRRKLDRLQHD
jgi:C-terminal processing protease CtpA/Prc